MKTFNLNDDVLVNITNYGWEMLDINYPKIGRSIIESKKEIINGVEYYRMQAHNIISYWGNAMWITSHSPIYSEILIP